MNDEYAVGSLLEANGKGTEHMWGSEPGEQVGARPTRRAEFRRQTASQHAIGPVRDNDEISRAMTPGER